MSEEVNETTHSAIANRKQHQSAAEQVIREKVRPRSRTFSLAVDANSLSAANP